MNILFVCLGNICRSPVAEGVFLQLLSDLNITNKFNVDSAGTSSYHFGNSPDTRSIENASRNNVKLVSRARQFTKDDFERFDYILAMDDANYRHICSLQETNNSCKVFKMRDFDVVSKGADVPDPYYGGENGFQEVFDILSRSNSVFLKYLMKEHGL